MFKAQAQLSVALLNAKHDLTREQYGKLLEDVVKHCQRELDECYEGRGDETEDEVYTGW